MKNDAPFYVYLLCRPDGTPCYVGKGKGNRWSRHERYPGRTNRYLRNIINLAKAAGQEMVKSKLADNLTEEQAFEVERYYIAVIGRKAHGGPLANMTDGGEGPAGYEPTPEHRAKVSAKLTGVPKSPEHVAAAAAGRRGKPNKFGWWSTEEGRAKQRANNPGHTGYKHSDETIAAIKAARARQPKHVSPSTEFRPGHQPSDESRANMRAAWARRKAAATTSQIHEGAMR